MIFDLGHLTWPVSRCLVIGAIVTGLASGFYFFEKRYEVQNKIARYKKETTTV